MSITLTVEGEAYLNKFGDWYCGLADVDAECIMSATGVLIGVENPRILMRSADGKSTEYRPAPEGKADLICQQLIDDNWYVDRAYEEFIAWREDTPARIGDARYDEARA